MNDFNLVPTIQLIEKEINEIERKCSAQIEPLKNCLASLRKINTACEYCGGDGMVLRSRACAEDDRPDPNDPRDWIRCSHCSGTGRKPIPVSPANV